MDQDRTVETERLKDAMDSTRASITGTVAELQHKVSDAVDWRSYVRRYPGVGLGVAAAAGLLAGRWVGGLLAPLAPDGAGEATPRGYADAVAHTVLDETERPGRDWERAAPPGAATRMLRDSGSRLGARVEQILNRLIDEVSDTVETSVVPALAAGFRDLLGFGEGARGRRPEPRADEEEDDAREARRSAGRRREERVSR